MRYYDGWHHEGMFILGWLLPLILVAGLAVLFVWALRRSGGWAATEAPMAPRTDAALETARMRYARGEIDRDDYARLAADLGGPVPPPTGS